MSEIVKVLHCITSLTPDGAQQMLYKVISQIDKNKFSTCVVNLRSAGIIGEELKKLGVEVIDLGMKPGILSISGIFKLATIIKNYKPQVLQGWMYHSNLM